MKVYLNTGVEGRKQSPHKIYMELLDHPPLNYVYSDISRDGYTSISRLHKHYWKFSHLIVHYSKIPKMNYIPYKKIDLIHANQYLILNRIPWVVDLAEHLGLFASSRSNKAVMWSTWRRIIEKSFASKHCKKIMPMTNGIKDTVFKYLDTSGFADKIEVVYPAHSIVEKKQKLKEGDKVKLLFIGTKFYAKGGKETLQSFEILNKKYDVELTMVSGDIPREINEKYKNLENLTMLSNISDREIDALYSESDVFVLPLFHDSLGVFLEAIAYGLPIISTNGNLISELVEDGKTGFVVNASVNWFSKIWYNWNEFVSVLKNTERPEVVKDLVDRISILIEDASLRKKMGRNARKKVERGALSIEERNKKLKSIYEEALKT